MDEYTTTPAYIMFAKKHNENFTWINWTSFGISNWLGVCVIFLYTAHVYLLEINTLEE